MAKFIYLFIFFTLFINVELVGLSIKITLILGQFFPPKNNFPNCMELPYKKLNILYIIRAP